MQILALDTASPVPSVTLLAAGAAVWEEPLSTPPPQQPRRASEELLPAIERCLAAAGTRLTDCGRIAVCAGPGSFTGIRIGLATAWGLGRAAGIPVETVSTLEALAETERDRGSSTVAAALDAGRGEIVLAVYSLDDDRARLVSGPARLSIEAARERAAIFRTVAMPAELLGSAAAAPPMSPSRALALAVARRPGEALARLQGIYSRPSAAEEKHGAP
jgi:tRNA threonylcarbamoyladenosine biosynthesis protein TsaB